MYVCQMNDRLPTNQLSVAGAVKSIKFNNILSSLSLAICILPYINWPREYLYYRIHTTVMHASKCAHHFYCLILARIPKQPISLYRLYLSLFLDSSSFALLQSVLVIITF